MYSSIEGGGRLPLLSYGSFTFVRSDLTNANAARESVYHKCKKRKRCSFYTLPYILTNNISRVIVFAISRKNASYHSFSFMENFFFRAISVLVLILRISIFFRTRHTQLCYCLKNIHWTHNIGRMRQWYRVLLYRITNGSIWYVTATI